MAGLGASPGASLESKKSCCCVLILLFVLVNVLNKSLLQRSTIKTYAMCSSILFPFFACQRKIQEIVRCTPAGLQSEWCPNPRSQQCSKKDGKSASTNAWAPFPTCKDLSGCGFIHRWWSFRGLNIRPTPRFSGFRLLDRYSMAPLFLGRVPGFLLYQARKDSNKTADASFLKSYPFLHSSVLLSPWSIGPKKVIPLSCTGQRSGRPLRAGARTPRRVRRASLRRKRERARLAFAFRVSAGVVGS